MTPSSPATWKLLAKTEPRFTFYFSRPPPLLRALPQTPLWGAVLYCSELSPQKWWLGSGRPRPHPPALGHRGSPGSSPVPGVCACWVCSRLLMTEATEPEKNKRTAASRAALSAGSGCLVSAQAPCPLDLEASYLLPLCLLCIAVLGMDPRDSRRPGKCSATELKPSPPAAASNPGSSCSSGLR